MAVNKFEPPLGDLENQVLDRIAAFRRSHAAGARGAPLLAAAIALASGLLTGFLHSHAPHGAHGSEAALLADEVTLAPSSLLASNQ